MYYYVILVFLCVNKFYCLFIRVRFQELHCSIYHKKLLLYILGTFLIAMLLPVEMIT